LNSDLQDSPSMRPEETAALNTDMAARSVEWTEGTESLDVSVSPLL
jgi:hypothetical protein